MNVEIFACSGGMAEGFRRAGIDFDVAIDRNSDACRSYAVNLGHRPRELDVAHLCRLSGAEWLRVLARGQPIDLLVADPPCTPWSYAGDRWGVEDPRDCLMITCELIRALRPRIWMVANVPGLDSVPTWPIVQRTIGALADLGYWIEYARLDAADYGVPQHRVRPFWVGMPRSVHPRWCWSAPSHYDGRRRTGHLFGGQPWVTCREALGHLSRAEIGRPVRLAWKPAKHHRPTHPDEPAKTITTNGNTDGALVSVERDRHPPSRWEAPAGTIVTGARAGKGATTMVSTEWPWDRPATTVQCDARLGSPGHHDPEVSNSQHQEAIVLSERARLILQGFPETWTICGRTKRSRDSQIGQAIPPPLAEAVARSIARVAEAQEADHG